jgi:predicted secreted protein
MKLLHRLHALSGAITETISLTQPERLQAWLNNQSNWRLMKEVGIEKYVQLKMAAPDSMEFAT